VTGTTKCLWRLASGPFRLDRGGTRSVTEIDLESNSWLWIPPSTEIGPR
jgi:hypothetical protein